MCTIRCQRLVKERKRPSQSTRIDSSAKCFYVETLSSLFLETPNEILSSTCRSKWLCSICLFVISWILDKRICRHSVLQNILCNGRLIVFAHWSISRRIPCSHCSSIFVSLFCPLLYNHIEMMLIFFFLTEMINTLFL